MMHNTARSLLLLPVLGVAFLLLPTIVVACALPKKPTVLQAFDESDVVVIARAISVEKGADLLQTPIIGTPVTATTMQVEKVFKGNLRVDDKIVFGQGNGIRCTWVFREEDIGDEYLFYLDSPPAGETLWYEYGLGRSASMEGAAEDLLYLNKLDKVRGRTRISGNLDVEDDGLSLEGQRIRIIGKNKTYVATTNKNGVYELYDVPPGRYVLEPDLQHGWKVDELYVMRTSKGLGWRVPLNVARVAFTLRPRKHFGVDLKLKLSNHVRGAIYDSNRKPMQWVCVSLVPANDESFLACNDLTDEQGRFRFDAVEAGNYVIILNYENKMTAAMPFPKLYYPGVQEREKAQTITVKHGESINNLNVVIKRH